MALFEGYAIAGDNGFVEGEPRLGTVPLDEFSDRVIVGSLRAGECQAVQNR